MSRFLSIGTVLALVASAWTSDAFAQRSAGWKINSAMGTGSGMYGGSRYSGSYNNQGGPAIQGNAASNPSESYRSFSFEPVPYQAGDRVVVASPNIRLMRGYNTVGTAPGGSSFTVSQVVNGWLGADFEANGRHFNGWIWYENVTPRPNAAPAPAGPNGGPPAS